MKKTILFLALLIIVSVLEAPYALAAPDNSASSAVLYDARGAATLFEDNADAKMLIASTTKIITALVVLENCRLDDVVTIKPEYAAVEGSSMYLKAGERLTVLELLYGLMLPSGNDAAVALACHTAGSVQKFADLMNQKAADLGCVNSSFRNPHGLDADGHYSTARDLAVFTAEAMKNNTFREIVSTKYITIAGRALSNHNKLLWSYDGMLGVKTGYTKSAGRSLVTCAERDGVLLVCVTLSDPDDWADHTAMYDWAFNSYQCVTVNMSDIKYVSLPVISGVKDMVTARPGLDFSYLCSKNDKLTVTVESPRFVYAGVIKGARAGRIVIRKNGEMVKEIPLVYTESVALDASVRLTAWEKIKRAWLFSSSRGVFGGPGYAI